MTDRLTLATSAGFPFLALAFHFATGMVAIVAGYTAIAVRKGATLHRRSGLIFVYAMIATGITAVAIATYEGKPANISGGVIVYFVVTAWTAVKPLPAASSRRADIALMLLALLYGALGVAGGFTALGMPGKQMGGVPAGMMFFLATVNLLAAAGDFRMIRERGIQGTRRIARHLWRMCFALFIAAGSFFFGQMKFIPQPIRIFPLIALLGVGPLLLLLYWMWRVRLRRNLRGIIAATTV